MRDFISKLVPASAMHDLYTPKTMKAKVRFHKFQKEMDEDLQRLVAKHLSKKPSNKKYPMA